MNSFYFDLIYKFLRENDGETASNITAERSLNGGGPAVIEGTYYSTPRLKYRIDSAKDKGGSLEELLSAKSKSTPYATCYELYRHITEDNSVKLTKFKFGNNHSDGSLTAIHSEDLERIAITLITAGCNTELRTFYTKLKEQLQSSLNNSEQVAALSLADKIGLLDSTLEERTRKSLEFDCLSTFIQSIDYGYALQGCMEQLKRFRGDNGIDEARYPLIHEHIIHALARGGHLDKVHVYIATHHLTIKNYNGAIIKGLAAVGHHQLLEKYCLENHVDTSTLREGLSWISQIPLFTGEHLRDEDALRMLIAAEDGQYRKMLQAALSKVYLLNTHLKFWDVRASVSSPGTKTDGQPSKWVDFPSLQKDTLWVYAAAIQQIMANRKMSYEEVVKTWFFIQEIGEDDEIVTGSDSLPTYVQPCYQWANSLHCLYSNDLDSSLKSEKAFEKNTILLKLTAEAMRDYIETIHLKPCDFTNKDITQKLNALRDFKRKTVTYLGSKTQENAAALADSAATAAAHFPEAQEISNWDKGKKISLGVLLMLVGIALSFTIVGAAYAWKGAYRFFKEAKGTRSNLEEIQEILLELQKIPQQTEKQQRLLL